MHEYMRHQVQLFRYLDRGYIHQTMELPTVQEKSEKFFFAQPKAHQIKFAETNKMMPMDAFWLIAFFKQCQAANKAAEILEKIAKEKKHPKEKKTADLPIRRSRDLSYRQHCCKNHDCHQSGQSDCND
jgi:hypothetical protein